MESKETIEIIEKILQIINENNNFFITGHIRPDPDTIGTELAMYSWLKRINKNAEIIRNDTIPPYLSYMKGFKDIKSKITPGKKYDVGILFDCCDTTRANIKIDFDSINTLICIDHHRLNKPLNNRFHLFIDPESSSCAELLWRIMKHANYVPTVDEATCLYSGIVSDTGRFQHANTTPDSFNTAAELLKLKIDPVFVYQHLYGTKSMDTLKLIGLALSTLQVDGHISYLEINNSMYEKLDSVNIDAEEIITFAGMIPDIKIFILFRELKNDIVKISLRSYNDIDLTKIAYKHNGGGHIHAAGFQINGSIKDIKTQIISELKSLYAI